jgi:hypothetical protein
MNMKKSLFLILTVLSLSLLPVAYMYAQEAPPEADTPAAIDLTTFTGIVAAVSLPVTQLAKIVPAVYEKTWLKIAVSVGVAVAASLLAWHFGWAQFPGGLSW